MATSGMEPVLTPGAWLAGFIKRTTVHCCTQKRESSRPCGFGEEYFYVFPTVSLWELMNAGAGPFLTSGAWLAGFIKKTTTHCYKQNMKALGILVSERIFLCDAPGAGPVWTPGARLAGFIKRTTIHCYTQNMKALGYVVSEEKIFYVL